jgi:hypothetical protein
MLLQYRRIIAILIFVIMTIIFIIVIPAICPGFPTPKITQVDPFCFQLSDGETFQCDVNASVTNQGTNGYVIVVTKLVNTTRNSIESKSSKTIYMKAGDTQTINTIVSVPRSSPCSLVVEAERRTTFNREF